MVQLSHLYMTTGKTTALTIWNFVGKVMSLLFHMLSRFVIAFLPRRKNLLISWLQSPCAVILEPKKIKFLTVSIVSPSICHEVMGSDALSRMWRKRSPRTSLLRIWIGAVTVENSMELPQETKNRIIIWSSKIPLLGIHLKKMKSLIQKIHAPQCSYKHYL